VAKGAHSAKVKGPREGSSDREASQPAAARPQALDSSDHPRGKKVYAGDQSDWLTQEIYDIRDQMGEVRKEMRKLQSTLSSLENDITAKINFCVAALAKKGR